MVQEFQYEDIDYISIPTTSNNAKTPIVFVHGAYNDARVWGTHFMPYFAQLGHPVYAIHLKDKKRITQWRILFSYRISDYVRRLGRLIQGLDLQPVLVGHSMGGLVIQRYLEQSSDRVKGIGLLASIAPFGMGTTLKSMLVRPWRLFQYVLLTLNPAIARKGKPPVGLLSDRVAPAIVKVFQSAILRESALALFGTMRPKIDTQKIANLPMVIIGAALDNLVYPQDVVRTGTIYEQEVHIFEKMGHFVMLEPDWELIAERIYNQLLE